MSQKEFKFTERDARYLWILYSAYESSVPVLGPSEVSEQLSVSKVTAYQELRKLVAMGYAIHVPSKGFMISEKGTQIVRQLIRNHRILETFFVHVLNMPLDEACSNARSLEFAARAEFIDRLCAFLGHPSYCPHGYEIPHSENCYKRRGKDDE